MKALWGRITRKTRIWLGIGVALVVVLALLLGGRRTARLPARRSRPQP